MISASGKNSGIEFTNGVIYGAFISQ